MQCSETVPYFLVPIWNKNKIGLQAEEARQFKLALNLTIPYFKNPVL